MFNSFNRFVARALMAFLSSCLLMLIVPATCRAQSTPVVSWQILDQRVTLHEPVILKLTVQNYSREPAIIDLGASLVAGIAITITTPAGSSFHPGINVSGLHPSGRVSIDPGATYSRVYSIDEWYEFESTGIFGIGVSLTSPIVVGAEHITPEPPTFYTITIVPRDVPALRKRCEALASQADGAEPGSSVEEEAVRILSAINDPVAVPYLTRLGSRTTVQVSVITAIGRFSTVDAIAALASFLHSGGVAATQSKVMLELMASRTKDPILMKKISDTLREQ